MRRRASLTNTWISWYTYAEDRLDGLDIREWTVWNTDSTDQSTIQTTVERCCKNGNTQLGQDKQRQEKSKRSTHLESFGYKMMIENIS